MLNLEENNSKTFVRFFSGAYLGFLVSALLQPFDLIKTRVQEQSFSSAKKKNTINEIRNLKSYMELWKGSCPSILRTTLGSGLYFSTFPIIKKLILQSNQYLTYTGIILKNLSLSDHISFVNFLSGLTSRVLVGFVLMPLTLIKIKSESKLYTSYSFFELIVSIYHNLLPNLKISNIPKKVHIQKKSLKNFYRGSVPTLFRDSMYSGLHLSIYLKLKSFFTDQNSKSLQIFFSSTVASFISILLTTPIDMGKTAVQLNNQKLLSKAFSYFINKNFFLLFRGLSLRIMKKSLTSGFTWCFYELLLENSFCKS